MVWHWVEARAGLTGGTLRDFYMDMHKEGGGLSVAGELGCFSFQKKNSYFFLVPLDQGMS